MRRFSDFTVAWVHVPLSKLTLCESHLRGESTQNANPGFRPLAYQQPLGLTCTCWASGTTWISAEK